LWVLPIAVDGDPTKLKQKLDTGLPEELRDERDVWSALLPKHSRVDGSNLMGAKTAEQLDALQAMRPTGGRDLADAWQALGQGGAGLIIFGDDDSRRVVRELFPTLPLPTQAIDGKLIADDLLWGGLALDFPPKLDAQLVIQSRDMHATKVLKQTFAEGLVLLKQLPPVREALGEKELERVVGTLAPQVEGTRLRISSARLTNDFAALKKVLGPPLLRARQAAQRRVRMNKLKNIGLAMHNFHSARKSFPAAAIRDDTGKPLLSWRVAILPYMNDREVELYRQFHLDEPWDSEHNQKLIEKMPDVFSDPDIALRKLNRAGRTTFVVPSGKDTIFSGSEGMTYKDITDGTSNTIMLVEVVPEKAAIWTKPDDWEVDFENPHEGVEHSDRDWFTTVFADGSARILESAVPAEKLRALLTPAGGEVID